MGFRAGGAGNGGGGGDGGDGEVVVVVMVVIVVVVVIVVIVVVVVVVMVVVRATCNLRGDGDSKESGESIKTNKVARAIKKQGGSSNNEIKSVY